MSPEKIPKSKGSRLLFRHPSSLICFLYENSFSSNHLDIARSPLLSLHCGHLLRFEMKSLGFASHTFPQVLCRRDTFDALPLYVPTTSNSPFVRRAISSSNSSCDLQKRALIFSRIQVSHCLLCRALNRLNVVVKLFPH